MRRGLRLALSGVSVGLLLSAASCGGPIGEDEYVGAQAEGLSKCAGGKLGDSNYCSVGCKCAAGEGDCDSAAECTAGLACVGKGAYFYGIASNACAPAHCGNKIQDAALGETQIDCGGPCGSLCPDPCVGLPSNGNIGHCTTACPCAPREGDCAADSARCEPGASCFPSQGAFFGFVNTRDICLQSTCSNGSLDPGETAMDCGPSCKPCSSDHVLSLRAGGASNDHAFTVATDASRSIIVGGRIEFGGVNAHIVKYDSAGALLWRRSLANANGGAAVTALGTDNARNIYVTGVFSNTAPFLGVDLTSQGSGDIFVLKLDPNGNRIWVKGFGSTSSERADAIAVRGNGEVFVAGSFVASLDFGLGVHPNAGRDDMFALKLDSAGNPVYSKAFGAAGTDTAVAIAVDGAGNATIAGAFQQSVDMGGTVLTSNGTTDAFIAKLTPSGAPSWAHGFGSEGADSAFAVAVDGLGQPAVVGQFKRSVDFGGGSVLSAGGTDAFLVAYTAGGAYRFGRTAGGISHDDAVAIAIDTAGGIAVAGDFQGTDAAFGSFGTRSSQGGRDIFVARYDAAGIGLSLSTFGGAAQDVPRAAAQRDGLLTIAGAFKDNVSFGGSPLSAAGEFDVFLARYAF